MMFDPSRPGLRKALKDYEELALRAVWESKGRMNTRAVWMEVNKMLSPESISRASIINFLQSMEEQGVLESEVESCKGGHRKLYTPKMDEGDFRMHLAKVMISSLLADFPEETVKAFKEAWSEVS